jgi:rubrerythrin
MDILVYAIKMELDGESYYKEQAKLNRGNQLYKIFMYLAEEESEHARILEEKSKGLSYKKSAAVTVHGQNVFTNLKDQKVDINNVEAQVNAYKLALEKEKESIDLYKKLMCESAESADLYKFLISQEEEHYALIEEIIKFLNRPNERVESAEFGIREEY